MLPLTPVVDSSIASIAFLAMILLVVILIVCIISLLFIVHQRRQVEHLLSRLMTREGDTHPVDSAKEEK